jgi:hypothetical protein
MIFYDLVGALPSHCSPAGVSFVSMCSNAERNLIYTAPDVHFPIVLSISGSVVSLEGLRPVKYLSCNSRAMNCAFRSVFRAIYRN